MGLVLKRRAGESIKINDDCVIRFHSTNSQCAKIEIIAPDHVKILRGEIENEESIQKTRS
jgi:carbon storage regulator CsrA